MKPHPRHLFLVLGLALLGALSPCTSRASGPWNGHAVAFCFTSDDGDQVSNLTWSNLFMERGLHYTIFIPSSWVGMFGSKLTADDLQSLHAEGFEIASHGRTHIRLTDIDDPQLLDELVGSCRDLETVLQDPGYHCRTIAYPEHAHDLHVMAVAESLGFTAARDGGMNPIGYPNFSLGKTTWSETSLFELPLTVLSSTLVGDNTYSEELTRAEVDTLIMLTTDHNVWVDVFAHTLNDIDEEHMTWILDELGLQDVWVTNFATVADFYRSGHGLSIPPMVGGGMVPVILSRFTAKHRKDGNLLQWIASGDLDYAGIYVERSLTATSGYARVNATLLSPNASGQYVDATPAPGITYYYRLEVLSRDGTSTFYGPVTASAERLDPGLMLGLAAPNPSKNSRSTIPFSLPQSGEVSLCILDITGRRVKTLIKEGMDAGSHTVSWNGRDDHGQAVPPGFYIYQLEALGVEATRKLFWIE